MLLLARFGHGLPELAQNSFEQRDNPLSVVKSLGRHMVDRLVSVSGLDHVEVEREDQLPATAFLGRPLLVLVYQKMAKGRQQKTPESPTLLFGNGHRVLFEKL